MTYTKGDWKVEHKLNVICDKRGICSCGHNTNVEPEINMNENEANAKIISSAPDMYEALNDILAQQSGQYELKSCGHRYYCTCPYDEAQKALAKAEGEA